MSSSPPLDSSFKASNGRRRTGVPAVGEISNRSRPTEYDDCGARTVPVSRPRFALFRPPATRATAHQGARDSPYTAHFRGVHSLAGVVSCNCSLHMRADGYLQSYDSTAAGG